MSCKLSYAAIASLIAVPCFGDDRIPAATFSSVSYGTHERNVLDFWQAKSDEPTPLAIYFYGGGFGVFDKSKIVKKWPATVKALLDAKISVAAWTIG